MKLAVTLNRPIILLKRFYCSGVLNNGQVEQVAGILPQGKFDCTGRACPKGEEHPSVATEKPIPPPPPPQETAHDLSPAHRHTLLTWAYLLSALLPAKTAGSTWTGLGSIHHSLPTLQWTMLTSNHCHETVLHSTKSLPWDCFAFHQITGVRLFAFHQITAMRLFCIPPNHCHETVLHSTKSLGWYCLHSTKSLGWDCLHSTKSLGRDCLHSTKSLGRDCLHSAKSVWQTNLKEATEWRHTKYFSIL